MKVVPFIFLLIPCMVAFGQSDYLDKALQAEKWIRAQRKATLAGTVWPVIPGDTITATNLYSGSAGVVLFYLELYQTTQKPEFLNEAKRGADYLVHQLNKKLIGYDEVGLLTGEAGICFTLKKVFEITKEEKYSDATIQSFGRLNHQAKQDNRLADWRYTDIVYGGAGIGLMLLTMADIPEAKTLAIKTGRALMRDALDAPGGKKWFIDSSFAKQNYYMPNFSHGTAGVSYFLAKLYQTTKEKEFLDAALAGASHLETIENKDAWVYHHDKEGGKELYYLSWCHGPAGTARLYYVMYQITKDKKWLDKMKKSAQALMQCGIPEKQTAGFWNNQGPCCGSAGVAEFFLDLHKVFGDKEYLAFSHHITEDLISRSTQDGEGIKWIQSEHRRQPDLLQAQTGYMQGAAGIGLWLLHFYAFEKKTQTIVKFPDDPF